MHELYEVLQKNINKPICKTYDEKSHTNENRWIKVILEQKKITKMH